MNRRDIFKSLLGVVVAVSIDIGMSSPARFKSVHEAAFKPADTDMLNSFFIKEAGRIQEAINRNLSRSSPFMDLLSKNTSIES